MNEMYEYFVGFAPDLSERLPEPSSHYFSPVVQTTTDVTSSLVIIAVFVVSFIFLKYRVLFSRPPPVPRKSLPLRPALCIQFKPDDEISATNETEKQTTASKSGSTIVTHASFDSVGDDTASYTSIGSTQASMDKGGIGSHSRSNSELPRPFRFDLPDSFAPLLSSSQTEMLLHHLTADLIHGIHAKAIAQIQEGIHEIPLDKNPSRPQFNVDVSKSGCRVSINANVGSDSFSQDEDLDVSIPTTSRSRPMVKHAEVTFDPPVSLKNVAPTLIHIPTLFEDSYVVPRYRRIAITRHFINLIIGISNYIEKVLWIVEGFLQIHLGRVRITPVYKGRSSIDDTSPEWRLALAFSGHCNLFGILPIPFINVILPTFIIPQPHALLEYLLSKQPLATAKIRRENIAEQKLTIAALDMIDTWNCQLELVATPPAVGIDLTMPGGVSLGMEFMHGRDSGAGKRRDNINEFSSPSERLMKSSGSRTSWTSNDRSESDFRNNHFSAASSQTGGQQFNANKLVPWKLELGAKGSIKKDKISFHLLQCSFSHDDPSSPIPATSQITVRGSLAVWKATPEAATVNRKTGRTLYDRRTFAHRAALAASETDSPSVAAMLLFPEDFESFHPATRLLQYDFAFDSADSMIDAITFSVGASHPMLNGGSMVTTIFESIYASGSVTARENATLDPIERKKKRNVLKHLPAVDFTFGVQNGFIPPESKSYIDDGQTRTLPRMDGARLEVQIIGGIDYQKDSRGSNPLAPKQADRDTTGGIKLDNPVDEGIKVIADCVVSSIILDSETNVNEFPEFEIFEGTKLRAYTSGKLGGNVKCHLKPQKLTPLVTSTGPNLFNPLEAYEIDCSGSNFSLRLRESTTSLGHRRLIIPSETTVKVKVVESIVDMSMEGKSELEILWDFQGLSPILQVTEVGLEPETANHENKEQVSLLIAPLRQGRLSAKISQVGGVSIEKAATSRDYKEGLYDWKFFNALVSPNPDPESAERLLDVIHDKRSMKKLLQVVRLINNDIYKTLDFVFTRVWRLKEIMDQEDVSEAKHIIPGHKMARLFSLLLCEDLSEVPACLRIIRRVTAGDGLDVVAVKELLRKYAGIYDDWTPEIDRGVRMLEVMFNPTPAEPFYVEDNVTPLAQLKEYSSKFRNIPSAGVLYDQIHDRPDLPLDRRFSNLVGRISPYLSFRQIEYLLTVRDKKDWQPSDLKRLRYVYSIKRKVMDIAESYGGLSFLPQSFLVSVFLGEATRSSLKYVQPVKNEKSQLLTISNRPSTLVSLRQRRARLHDPSLTQISEKNEDFVTPAARVASSSNFQLINLPREAQKTMVNESNNLDRAGEDREYELGDCLLGPGDVAILLQAGLTSVMKGSSVVQLNQRMLLDLVASQPKSFAVAVLAEIGTPSGQGSPRQLASALMALLELDQSAFRPQHQLDMKVLLESWLPGMRVPRREDYMAGGRWARQSYYQAIFSLAKNILEDAECYMALNSHLQRYRHADESDPIPSPQEELRSRQISDVGDRDESQSKLTEAIQVAIRKIKDADLKGEKLLPRLLYNEKAAKRGSLYSEAISAYHEAFEACARVRDLDPQSFTSKWFRVFYQRNYNALMIKSVFDNLIDNADDVRYWMHCLQRGAKHGAPRRNDDELIKEGIEEPPNVFEKFLNELTGGHVKSVLDSNCIFLNPTTRSEQELVDAIIDSLIYDKYDREKMREDPLVRLLIPNRDGNYDFTVVTAMGVITDGKAGTELHTALQRLEEKRGVKFIRADTATARSFEYNAERIIEAIESTKAHNVPFGLIGYSQGCANSLMAESILFSGTPAQQEYIKRNLACRQLLFSAANGSAHGSASDKKATRLIVMLEEFAKYQQGYFSRALQTAFLETVTSVLDSSQFHKSMGGAQGFLHDGCRAFWREAQHLPNVPTCTLRGVLEEHTTPEALEMLSQMLTKQSGSALHDSQVHAFDAVGYPVYHHNRNGRILKNCEIGAGAIQRTHHWSPLKEEVAFIQTSRDHDLASFDCAKDRHIFPWVDVNARFGFIKYSRDAKSITSEDDCDEGI
mmetsp:Transcript_10567/g.30930  ORF Transcript_10567/g.30930 Transcript_10567/m.30930 type:complete len:2039 (-) Transcript_10567:1916-8032(-)